jgi:putative ABC transport system ATP-binding protein
MNVVEVRDVVKIYGAGSTAVRALDHVTLHVRSGEFVALCGPSGSGKSTFLHLAGGLDHATGGTIRVCGRDLGTLSPTELSFVRRSQVGYVFQRYNLVPSLTAAENVMLPLELDGVAIRDARKAALEALSRVGLARPYDRYPDDLSGGEQQRVAIARAITGDRAAVLADEPTGAVDTMTGELILELLVELAGQGTAIVLVTHEPRFASCADRVVFMRDGRIAAEASAPTEMDGDASLAEVSP